MSDLYDVVVSKVKTQHDRALVYAVLEKMEKSEYSDDAAEMGGVVPPGLTWSEPLEMLIKEEGVGGVVEKLRDKLGVMREVVVRTVLAHDEKLAQQIHDWLELENGFVHLLTDTRMIGGAVVEVDGAHVDKSLRSWLKTKD